jgi:hypothetical protein
MTVRKSLLDTLSLTNLEMFLDIVIADAFLAQEIGKASPASGMEDTADVDEGIMWLVEKWRPTTVYRYTGTLSHRSQGKDQRSSTIYAYSHFVYGHSNKTLVIADLQGRVLHSVGTLRLTLYTFFRNPYLHQG